MRDTSWDTPYIHGNQEANETSQVKNLDSLFTIYLDRHKHEFTPENFLQACWTNGFETPCNHCGEPCDVRTEPPVRLLSLGEDMNTMYDPLMETLPPLAVKNFHLRCLKANQIKFIPVSHPWHPSIAEAYALRTFNVKAGQTCYEAPVRTLLAVNRRFGSDYLLWHDYISIPQWQDDFRGTVILPQIFKIFEASGSAVLHIGLKPPQEVVRTPTLAMIKEHNDKLKSFFSAHLFRRLWPIVESDRAGQTYIMDQKYEIMESKFSVFMAQISSAIDDGTTTISCKTISWINDLPLFIREGQQNKCLGYVYDMIADLGCRSYRDKFIGAAELLRISNYPKELPENAQDACLWLAETQIKSNDLSPLLLRPSTETPYHKAGWLKGHTTISRNMWDWGVQIHSAYETPQLQEHRVQLNMNLVGKISYYLSWHLQAENQLQNASNDLLSLITSVNGSTTKFLSALSIIDRSSIFRSLSSHNVDQIPQLEFFVSSSDLLVKVLGSLLEQAVAVNSAKESVETLKICDQVISLLALSASVPTPQFDHFKTFTINQLRRQICDPFERSLVSIFCSNCLRQSIFRVEIWENPKSEAQLYLVPGLTYQSSASNGIGIVVEKNRIIGRARFCASACNCNRSVLVEIT